MAENSSSASLSFPPGEVVKQGYLYVKRPPRRYWSKLKAWHKRYFVLRDDTQDRGPLLEMYKRKEITTMFGIGAQKLTLDLSQCVHIGFTSDSSRFPYTLVVVCQGRSPLLLAAEDELGARSWVLALGLITHKGSGHNWKNLVLPAAEETPAEDKRLHPPLKELPSKESTVSTSSLPSTLPLDYSECGVDTSFARSKFNVVVHPTECSERAEVSGELQLVVFSHGVGLARPGSSECFVMWPVAFIRQYRHEAIPASSSSRSRTTLVTLEVGRRCATGEGVFQFKTHRGQDIIRELKLTVEMWSTRKAGTILHSSHSDPRTSSPRITSRIPGESQSAHCTPTLALPHSWQKGRLSPGPPKRADCTLRVPQKDDVNYIFPVFDHMSDSTMSDSGTSSPRPPSTASNRLSPSQSVPAGLGKDNFRLERLESDESYVEIFAKDPQSEEVDSDPGSPQNIAVRNGVKKSAKPTHEDTAYIEVLPT